MLFFDFYFFYAAGIILQNGGDPYSLSAYHDALISVGYPLDKIVVPFPYPPWTFWLFYLLGSVPFTSSLVVFSVVQFSVGCVAAHLACRSLIGSAHWLTGVKVLVLYLTFVPTLKCLFFGQLTWLLFIAVALAPSLMRYRQHFLSGALLSLVLIKPHLSLCLYGFILGFSIRARCPPLMLGFVAGGLLQVGLSKLVYDYDLFFAISRLWAGPHGLAEHAVLTASLVDLAAHRFNNVSGIQTFAAALAVASGVFIGARTEKARFESSLILGVVPISVVLAPYSWSHDYLLLFPAFVASVLAVKPLTRERYFLFTWLTVSLTTSLALYLNHERLLALLCLPILATWFFNRGARLGLRPAARLLPGSSDN
jgi:hypothetical protein